jgi:uncharacterized damage-inducible protein DinB
MNREDTIASYASGYKRFKSVLKEVPPDALHFKPSPKAWSIHQIVIHLADSEVSGYDRFRKAIAENGVTVAVYDHNAWAERLHYDAQDTRQYLKLLKYVRATTSQLLRSIPDETWDNHIIHPENGKMTLADLVPYYDTHITKHCDQVRRNVAAWEKAGRPAKQ